jgi:hypothetical protein
MGGRGWKRARELGGARMWQITTTACTSLLICWFVARAKNGDHACIGYTECFSTGHLGICDKRLRLAKVSGLPEKLKERKAGRTSSTPCSFRWFIVAESTVRWFVMLWEKNTAGWLLIPLIERNEQGARQEAYSVYPQLTIVVGFMLKVWFKL